MKGTSLLSPCITVHPNCVVHRAGSSESRRVRLIGDEPHDPLADEGVAVNRQNPNRIAIGTHDFIATPFPENFSDNQKRRRDVA